MENKEWYIIRNLPEFIDHARRLVFKFFGQVNEDSNDSLTAMLSSLSMDEEKELDSTLSFAECENIAKQFLKKKNNKKTKTISYYINDSILMKMLESFNNRMISNILNKLVNNGLLESAFDEENNDFIFWVKDDENKKETPETD
jgi:hypothetical protein